MKPKITVRKVKRYFAVGRIIDGEWRILRGMSDVPGFFAQLIYPNKKKADACAKWVRQNWQQKALIP